MDVKTLEYMQERVKKGNEILDRIETLETRIETAKNALRIVIANRHIRNYFEVSNHDGREKLCTFETHAEAMLINTFIDLANAEIKRLEAEFAEI